MHSKVNGLERAAAVIVSQSTKLLSKFVKQWEIFLSFLLCKLVPTIFGRNLTMGTLGTPNANDISLQIFVPVHSNSKC